MLSKTFREVDQDELPLFDEQEKHDLYIKKTSHIREAYEWTRRPRFCTNGISILHQVFLIAFLMVTVHFAYRRGLYHPEPTSFRSFVPQIEQVHGPVVFTDSADWSGNTSRAAVGWNKWLKNFDTHTISISLDSIQEFGYEPGLPDVEGYQRFGISMFHQLHCLATIREFAYLPDAMRMPDGKPLDHDGVEFSPFHMDHCFNYLRQAIECAADSTVEWAKYDKNGKRKGIQGWGIPHFECRNRDALEAFALEHHGTIV